jgi:hypothetical protein
MLLEITYINLYNITSGIEMVGLGNAEKWKVAFVLGRGWQLIEAI